MKTLFHQRQRALRWLNLKRPLVQPDREIAAQLTAADSDVRTLSEALVRYFWQTHLHHRHAHGSKAYYPGWPSIYGARNDAIEGVTRLMPLWAAYGTSAWADGELAAAMGRALTQTLTTGTDPAHPGYWGDIADRSTLICEAADVALAVWLGRDWLWPRLGPDVRQRVLTWLSKVVGKRTADNNWHLFVVQVDAVLACMKPGHRFSSQERLARVQSFAVGEGCYIDGPGGAVDLYNAWGFHYSLYWLGEMGLMSEDAGLNDFCRWYQCLFTPHGLPLFGRSLCYRHAASAPLVLCASCPGSAVQPAQALAAWLANWRAYARDGGVGLGQGRPTQGVFGDDARWLDPYSGPASSLWGTRSLVALLYTGRGMDWAAVLPGTLPATRCAATVKVGSLCATIHVDAEAASSELIFDGPAPAQLPNVQHPTWRDRLRQLLRATASRPANNLRKAGVLRFHSSNDIYRSTPASPPRNLTKAETCRGHT